MISVGTLAGGTNFVQVQKKKFLKTCAVAIKKIFPTKIVYHFSSVEVHVMLNSRMCMCYSKCVRNMRALDIPTVFNNEGGVL